MAPLAGRIIVSADHGAAALDLLLVDVLSRYWSVTRTLPGDGGEIRERMAALAAAGVDDLAVRRCPGGRGSSSMSWRAR